MKFAKLTLLLATCLAGHALMAGDTAPAITFTINRLKNHKIDGWKIIQNTYAHKDPTHPPTCFFDNELCAIASLDNDIAKKEIPIHNKALLCCGIAGLTTGLFSYAKTFSNFQPRNRILSALGTLATTASLVYCASRSALTRFTDIPQHKKLLNAHCTYLPQRFAQEDIADHRGEMKKQLHMNAINNYRNKNNWFHNKRAYKTYLQMVRADD